MTAHLPSSYLQQNRLHYYMKKIFLIFNLAHLNWCFELTLCMVSNQIIMSFYLFIYYLPLKR